MPFKSAGVPPPNGCGDRISATDNIRDKEIYDKIHIRPHR